MTPIIVGFGISQMTKKSPFLKKKNDNGRIIAPVSLTFAIYTRRGRGTAVR